MSEARYVVGDVFERMAEIPDGSIDLVVTSPPFLALRSYLPADHPDKHKEIGSETTPAEFLSTLLALTREWRRVLAPHGSICVELGDTYSGSGGAGGDYNPGGLRDGQPAFDGSQSGHRRALRKGYGGAADRLDAEIPKTGPGWPLAKSLCLLPTLYPASLAYGRNLLDPDDTIDPQSQWRVRNLIVWHRPNPPVGALGDKVRPSTSYITTACVSGSRWFDLDAERTEAIDQRHRTTNGPKQGDPTEVMTANYQTRVPSNPAGAPPLDAWFDTTTQDVWTIPTHGYTGSHYATFPPALPRRLINLMCPRQVCVVCGEPRRRITENQRDGYGGIYMAKGNPNRADNGASAFPTADYVTLGWTECDCLPEDYLTRGLDGVRQKYRRGVVLDPFAGSGTTLMAASELGRDSIGIDLDPRNVVLAEGRLGMFLSSVEYPDEARPEGDRSDNPLLAAGSEGRA